MLYNLNFSHHTGVPQAPAPILTAPEGGGDITIRWKEPFSSKGFPVLSYNLTVQNLTSGYTVVAVVLPGGTLSYSISASDAPVLCYSLSVSITARNMLGVSDEGRRVFLIVSTICGE